jgi:hypothetical protein
MIESIASIDDLRRIKHVTGADTVTVYSGPLKRRGLLRHGIKYGLWALRLGGSLIVQDDGPVSFSIAPGKMAWSRVKQQVFKVLGPDAELDVLDDEFLTIGLRRTRPLPTETWSAGIVFSGDAKEVPALEQAVAGLRAQPELSQIMVCGPAAAEVLLSHLGPIDYVPYDIAHRRPPIPQKKNALVTAARAEKVAILHARIVLQPGCLRAMPADFDIITPRVEYHEADRIIPYLDWNVTDALDGETLARRQPPLNTYSRNDYLALMQLGLPYIDGGLFMINRSCALETPMNEYVAWGEAEDLEWCGRLHANGRLIDLEPSALALSQTFKWPRRMIDQPRLYAAARFLKRAQRRITAAFPS